VTFTSNLVHHPRQLQLRRAAFQIHLWGGLALALYLVVISLSGSILVFKDELLRGSLPSKLRTLPAGRLLSPAEALHNFLQTEPRAHLDGMQLPSPVLPAFLLEGTDAQGRATRWLMQPQSGGLETRPPGWIDWVNDLHNYLLLPKAWGMQVNGIGAGILLVLAVTGLVLWWPGVKVWTRGLKVRVRANWRRVNYDLHSAIGFWTLAIVLWWAVSGVYFGYYRQVTGAVGLLSPVIGMQAPAAAHPEVVPGQQQASLKSVIAAGQTASPHGRLWSVSNPQLDRQECYLLFDLEAPGDFSHRDIVRVRAADAQVLSVWHYGEKHSLSDWILWSMHPLHFGTLWGLTIKILWSTLGVLLAVLTITGVLMYWNRFLSRFSKEQRMS
jgi:uncharacterized iron-regulated membrane protein